MTTSTLTTQRADAGTVHRIVIEECLADGTRSPIDVSAASGPGQKVIKFKDPHGILTSREASFSTDGTDGAIEYVTTPGDVVGAKAGTWLRQAYVALPTWQGHTPPEAFTVEHNL